MTSFLPKSVKYRDISVHNHFAFTTTIESLFRKRDCVPTLRFYSYVDTDLLRIFNKQSMDLNLRI